MKLRPSAPARVPKAFLSYDWGSEAHKRWVRRLAARLENQRIDVTLDQWKDVPRNRVTAFMESAVRDSDFVLIVVTERYRDRSNGRVGGAGYEGDIMTAEVMHDGNRRKFIPLLREGDEASTLPTWLSGSACLDFRGRPYAKRSFDELVQTLHGTRKGAPPLGQRRAR